MHSKKLIWILPILAAVFTVWLLFRFANYNSHYIEVSFEDAAGIQVEQTQLRYRGVEIGLVRKVLISKDNKSVIVTIALNKGAEHFAVKGSTFWIVRPRMNIQGITGLETLVEGSYITVRPGDPDQKVEKEFVALNSAPVLPDDDQSVSFKLTARVAGSLNAGDAIRYRGIKIGVLSKVDLSRNSQRIDVTMNIMKPYRRLIRVNSVFNRIMGVRAKLGLFKSELKIETLNSLLQGGIELNNPSQVGPQAKVGHLFWLDEAPPKDSDKWEPKVNIY
ncbi:MAG: MlaD family protein [Bdellovibrionota bacterium]